MTTSLKRNSGLDLVRAMAILLVLFLHQIDAVHTTPYSLKVLAIYGWSGVDIFFVLSGFLIGSQVFKSDFSRPYFESLKEFWTKRWFRTLPLYLFVLFFYMVIKPLVLGFPFVGDKWTYFFFLQNIFGVQDFAQSWSLCIEEHFYLFFPILVYFFTSVRRKPYLILIPLLISILMRVIIISKFNIQGEPELSHLIRFPTYTNLDGISLGVLLSFTQARWRPIAAKYSSAFFGVGVAFFALTLFLCGAVPTGAGAVIYPTFLAIGAGLMVIGGNYIQVPKILTPLFYWISICSYGAYLWNNVFIRIIQKYFVGFHWLLGSAFFYLGTFLMAFITYKLIEQPFLRLRDKFLFNR